MTKPQIFNNKIKLLCIIIIGLVLRLINLNQSFWLDEAAQVIESSRRFSEQLNLVADFHPPLFHLLLHFWIKLGNSEVWIRLLSVIFGIFSIVLLYKLGIALGKRKEALLASFLLAISPYHIWYSQEARPYMLFVFISLLSTYFLIKRNWFSYTLTIILSLYSLYFAPFLVIGHVFYIIVFRKKEIMLFTKTIIIAIIFFIPWLPSFYLQLKTGTNGFFSGWTNIVSIMPLKAVPLTFSKFIFGHGSFENKLLYSVIVIPVFILFFIGVGKELIRKEFRLLILFFVPFISALTISFFVPVIAPQRLIFLLPFFLLILAEIILKLGRKLKILVLAIVYITNIVGLTQYYIDPYTQREQWRQAVSFTERPGDKNSMALFVFPDPFAPYLWYKKDKIDAIGIAPKFKIREEDLNQLVQRLKNKKRIFLYQYLTGLTDPDNMTQKFLVHAGYNLSEIKDFPGVGFIYVYDL